MATFLIVALPLLVVLLAGLTVLLAKFGTVKIIVPSPERRPVKYCGMKIIGVIPRYEPEPKPYYWPEALGEALRREPVGLVSGISGFEKVVPFHRKEGMFGRN